MQYDLSICIQSYNQFALTIADSVVIVHFYWNSRENYSSIHIDWYEYLMKKTSSIENNSSIKYIYNFIVTYSTYR